MEEACMEEACMEEALMEEACMQGYPARSTWCGDATCYGFGCARCVAGGRMTREWGQAAVRCLTARQTVADGAEESGVQTTRP